MFKASWAALHIFFNLYAMGNSDPMGKSINESHQINKHQIIHGKV